ncbi:J domain-containing protein [Collinsella tanakaei]|uniref:J domain-containing protein n=1 Tax=Collinsella tanakaei TaxID=626935 RepID=UPI0025A32EA0|nr:J domain-containing protein [Collinsella tanakaei]MDM8299456.1 J domain-containing protein [Collinsella tanakaei]
MTRDEALNVLGLAAGASREEISAAYRELAQMLHPDKYGDNKRLRARAEQQMRTINEARDVLLKGARSSRRTAGGRTSSATASSPASIAFEATARANAAETARLSVVADLRTMRERRRSMLMMAGVAAVIAFFFSRMRGGIGLTIFSVASMVAVWGVIDAVLLSSQVDALQKRSRELLQTRDAARKIAEEASQLGA